MIFAKSTDQSVGRVRIGEELIGVRQHAQFLVHIIFHAEVLRIRRTKKPMFFKFGMFARIHLGSGFSTLKTLINPKRVTKASTRK